jgi:hypothetical protein
VEYLGGGPAGRHDRTKVQGGRTIWWCGTKRIGEFLLQANAAILLLAYRAQNHLLITLTKFDSVASTAHYWVPPGASSRR